MAGKKPQRVREQVVVYLDGRDRALLDQMVAKTGLPKTELFRRGLRHLANETLVEKKPGWSLDYLVATASDQPFPPDGSERLDYYLYGGGYEKWFRKTRKRRARPG